MLAASQYRGSSCNSWKAQLQLWRAKCSTLMWVVQYSVIWLFARARASWSDRAVKWLTLIANSQILDAWIRIQNVLTQSCKAPRCITWFESYNPGHEKSKVSVFSKGHCFTVVQTAAVSTCASTSFYCSCNCQTTKTMKTSFRKFTILFWGKSTAVL